MDTLQEYKEYAEKEGLNVYAIALKGSQNYNLSDDESDIDANLVFMPTIPQLRKKHKAKFTFKDGEVTCHDIYSFAEIVAKGNPQWVEVCHSDYTIGDLSLFKHHTVNPSALKGMFMEKVHAFSKLYPSRARYVKTFGYDPKQLHHIIRLYDLLVSGECVMTYTGEIRNWMMQVKRGHLPNPDAVKLRDKYVGKLSEVYEDRKLKYKPQTVDYDAIDKLVLSSIPTK